MLKRLIQPYEKSPKSCINHFEHENPEMGFFSENTMN